MGVAVLRCLGIDGKQDTHRHGDLSCGQDDGEPRPA